MSKWNISLRIVLKQSTWAFFLGYGKRILFSCSKSNTCVTLDECSQK